MMKDYFLGVHQQELERLDRQHLAWQPETQQLIQDAQLANCERILDLGCGPGFTTFELAKQCPNAQVTALDKATLYQQYLQHQIQEQQASNITPLHADILDLPNKTQLYQGAFCRWVLAFLIADLPAVLKSIYDKLEPGGTFAAMEYLTLDSFTSSPPSDYFTAYTQAWKAYYLNHSGDANIGTYLPNLMREAGFTITSEKCVGGLSPVGHRWWFWWRDAFNNFAPTFVEQDLMTQAEFDGMAAYWDAQEAAGEGFIYSAVILQVVGRKEK